MALKFMCFHTLVYLFAIEIVVQVIVKWGFEGFKLWFANAPANCAWETTHIAVKWQDLAMVYCQSVKKFQICVYVCKIIRPGMNLHYVRNMKRISYLFVSSSTSCEHVMYQVVERFSFFSFFYPMCRHINIVVHLPIHIHIYLYTPQKAL
jgi:hypothetical protein